MHRIYQKSILTVGASCLLDREASQHVLKALRLRIGECLVLFNGEGGEYSAQLMSAVKGMAEVKILEFIDVQREPRIAVHLGQCLSRGERMDYAIQKAVEVGVAHITPLFCERSQVKLSPERMANRLRHWQQIIISASEQSGRTILPQLHKPLPIEQWIRQCEGKSFICDFGMSEKSDYNLNVANLLIGPEGGFDPLEVELAREQGFESLYLGNLTLRTETAPVVAITLLQCKIPN